MKRNKVAVPEFVVLLAGLTLAGWTHGDQRGSKAQPQDLGPRQAIPAQWTIPQSDEEARALVRGCTLEDVIGDHNPRMIGIWGGKLTQDSWFLRAAVGNRDRCFDDALDYFWLAFNRLPQDIGELHAQGFFPFCGTDPVTGEPYRYGFPLSGHEDFLDIYLETSTDDWFVSYNCPFLPKGQWFAVEGHLRGTSWPSELVEKTKDEYPNVIAIRGAHLAWQLALILLDYALRRNEMPACTEDLLDGLWIPQDSWVQNSPGSDWTQPGGFMFGIDESHGVAVAMWRDDLGVVYREAYSYSPWPKGGWMRVPTFYEYVGRIGRNPAWSDRADGFFENVPPDYAPEVELWACSLLL